MIKVKIHKTDAKTFDEFKKRFEGHPGLRGIGTKKKLAWLKSVWNLLKPKEDFKIEPEKVEKKSKNIARE